MDWTPTLYDKPIYLFNPPAEQIEQDRPVSPPLGIASLAGHLLHSGIDNIILADGYLTERARLGNAILRARRTIAERQPVIFGMSLVSGMRERAFDLLTYAKSQGAVTVVGGVAATIHSQGYAGADCIDYVVRGEGEQAFSLLCSAIMRKANINDVPNITYKNSNGIVITETAGFLDMNTIPFPARHLFTDVDRYNAGRAATIEESRGCINDCSFCAIKKIHKRVRLKSPERIREELHTIVSESKPSSVRFVSENALLTEHRAEAIAGIMKEANVPWMINAHPRLVLNRQGIFRTLLNSGLSAVEIGIESGSDRILEMYNKQTTSADNASVLRFLAGIEIDELRIEYIMFNPLMNYGDLCDAFQFIYDNRGIFLKDAKFPKQLFTEMYLEEGIPFFELIRNAGLLMEIDGRNPSTTAHRQFTAMYADERVASVKQRANALKLAYAERPLTIDRKIQLLEEFRRLLQEG